MFRDNKKRLFVYIFLVLLFLCAVPAVSHAAQQNPLPEPTDEAQVPAGTTVKNLISVLNLQEEDLTCTVRKTDGSTRDSGFVETGDLAVIKDAWGNIMDCIKLLVGDSDSQSEPPSSNSSHPESSSAPAPESEVSSNPVEPGHSSEPPVSSSSSNPSGSEVSSPSSGIEKNNPYIFKQSVKISSLQSIPDLQMEGCTILVTSASGIKKESGYLCTGDTISVLNLNGTVIRTKTATVLGDLTRCGKVTESGCSLLYNCLTNQSSLKSDQLSAADMNQDGKVDTADLLAMKKALADAA